MDKQTEGKIVARAAVLYREWEAQQEVRPWRVKVWDRLKSECTYRLARLRAIVRPAPKAEAEKPRTDGYGSTYRPMRWTRMTHTPLDRV